MATRPRVVIASPDRLESGVIADWIGPEGFEPVRRSTVSSAVEEMQARSFDLLIADHAFAFQQGLHAIARGRRPQTPTVVVGDRAAAAQSDAVNQQVMYLSRPIEQALLVCSVSMAVVDGRPVRRSVRKTAHRFNAIVNGVPSYIIDVSNEGLRIELPAGRRSILPPYFNAHVPLVGVAVTVQRMWARTWPGESTAVMLYGAALTHNPKRAAKAWETFVDTIPVVTACSSPRPQIK
jgi:DNA-binding response OmpR family regulator